MHDLRARDLPKIDPDPSLALVQPRRGSGGAWERLGRVWRSSGRALRAPRPQSNQKLADLSVFRKEDKTNLLKRRLKDG